MANVLRSVKLQLLVAPTLQTKMCAVAGFVTPKFGAWFSTRLGIELLSPNELANQRVGVVLGILVGHGGLRGGLKGSG